MKLIWQTEQVVASAASKRPLQRVDERCHVVLAGVAWANKDGHRAQFDFSFGDGSEIGDSQFKGIGAGGGRHALTLDSLHYLP